MAAGLCAPSHAWIPKDLVPGFRSSNIDVHPVETHASSARRLVSRPFAYTKAKAEAFGIAKIHRPSHFEPCHGHRGMDIG